ncbi:MAG: amino acid permease [Verrucomicrobia bacterium]|nr:amino acid permease [Verrucomicrobiota bacterium]
MKEAFIHRPRNVDWKRAAALLYGDWGTSKAYVLGLAFVAAGFSALPIILAVCALTAVVAYNYVIICKNFPDGGGVYSAARDQSRLLAVTGALLLVADMTVTAALSGWAALSYFGVPDSYLVRGTVAVILAIGAVNFFGPRHSGSVAVTLAIPTVIVVLILVALSLPHLTTDHLTPPHESFGKSWVAFVGVILALSGVEAIANLTGVMKLDPDAPAAMPRVGRAARRSIGIVAVEVVLGTAFLGWAMLSLPSKLGPRILERKEDVLRFLGEYYGGDLLGTAFGDSLGWVIGTVVGLLLLSAVNTAVVALIGLMYMMARDGEMPPWFARLNRHGVPSLPLTVAMALPVLVLLFTENFEALAGLYAVGVVGAITVNLGSCFLNRKLGMQWFERGIMGLTFLVLLAVEITIAKTKPDALFFACCVLGAGIGLRAYGQQRAGLRPVLVHKDVAATISSEALAKLRPDLRTGQRIMVAARGVTPALQFALEEARLRQGTLYVLYVKELAVSIPVSVLELPRLQWRDDPQAAAIMHHVLELAKPHNLAIIPLYAVSENAAGTILDLSSTFAIDFLILGASQRRFFGQLLRGNVIESVVRELPDNIQLLIHG